MKTMYLILTLIGLSCVASLSAVESTNNNSIANYIQTKYCGK